MKVKLRLRTYAVEGEMGFHPGVGDGGISPIYYWAKAFPSAEAAHGFATRRLGELQREVNRVTRGWNVKRL